jgi:hypothetical protein
LFDTKWRNQDPAIDNFLDYFSKNWTKEGKCGWYEGYCQGLPSTSNALEATHTHMKSKMERRSKPLCDFLGSQGHENGLIYEWSLERAEKLPIIDPITKERSFVPNNNRKIYRGMGSTTYICNYTIVFYDSIFLIFLFSLVIL